MCRSFFQLVGDLSELKNKKYEDILNGKEGLEHKSEPDREFNDIQLNDLEVRTGCVEKREMIKKIFADRKVGKEIFEEKVDKTKREKNFQKRKDQDLMILPNK